MFKLCLHRCLAVLLIGLAGAAGAHEPGHDHASASAAPRMYEAATQLLKVLPAQGRTQALRAFDDADRLDWHYVPRSRKGIALKDLDTPAREAVHALLRSALSATGYRKAVNIIELELVLREIERFGWTRDPERYHLTIYGQPDRRQAWAWRFEGHHLSLNFTLAGDRLAADTPSFFGASPATVDSGAKKGLRALGDEHDAGWALLESLSPAQRREAVFDTRTYGDIVTGAQPQVTPPAAVGIAAARLDDTQRALLWKLVETYARSFEPSLAEARLTRAREGGIENLRFGWTGATVQGRPHYYRVQGPQILIEYDASQNDGNHIHTVWRDFNGDFGRDLLREHYATAQGTAHRH